MDIETEKGDDNIESDVGIHECVICLEYIPENKQKHINCCHSSYFHQECYNNYIKKGFKTCPVCRTPLKLEQYNKPVVIRNDNANLTSSPNANKIVTIIVRIIVMYIISGSIGGFMFYLLSGSDNVEVLESTNIRGGIIINSVSSHISLYRKDFKPEWDSVVIKMIKNHKNDDFQGIILNSNLTSFVKFNIDNIKELDRYIYNNSDRYIWNIPEMINISLADGSYNFKLFKIKTIIEYYNFNIISPLYLGQAIAGLFIGLIIFGIFEYLSNLRS